MNFKITISILYILDLKYSKSLHIYIFVYNKKSELFFYIIFKNYSKLKIFGN